MATFRGKGSLKNVPLIVQARKGHASKGVVYLEIQKDQSLFNPEKVIAGEKDGKVDPYPHLNRKLVEFTPEGATEPVTYTSKEKAYSVSQYEQMLEAAGPAVIEDKDGNKILGINADLFINKNKELVVNTKAEMTTTSNKHFGENTLDAQDKVTKAARTRVADLRAAQAQAQQEHEAEALELETDEPELDA